MAKFNSRLEVLRQGPIDQNGKVGSLHTIHDPSDPPNMEAEVLEYSSKKSLGHPIVRPLYIKLDRHKASLDGGMPKVMRSSDFRHASS